MRLTDLILKSKLSVREISSQESCKLKQVLLEIYSDILNVCKKNNLTCFLGGGSCLGAVRHKGFIPWDDDLDLLMFRKEYDLLPQLIEKEYKGKYNVISPITSQNVPYAFYKVEKTGTNLVTLYDSDETPCISIDIFPIESIPNCKIRRLFLGIHITMLSYVALCVKLFKKHLYADKFVSSTLRGKIQIVSRKFVGFLFSWKSYSNWYKIVDKISSRQYDSDLVSIPTGRKHFFGEIQKSQVFYPPKILVFEGIDSYVPNCYDYYLKTLYGDYMQIPPIERREKHFILNISFGD